MSDIERALGGDSRTLRTVTALKARHPGIELALVVGADLEPEIDSWYGAEELRRSVELVIVGRAGHPGGGEVAMPAISSTEVRERLRRGAPVTGLIPGSVLDYIRQRKLYGVPDPI